MIDTFCGADAGPTGVIVPGTVIHKPVPAEFDAATWHVYAVPFVNPDIVIGLVDDMAIAWPGTHNAVYPVIAAPPLNDGAVKLNVIDPLPAVTVTFCG
jgi:hypothetical protein